MFQVKQPTSYNCKQDQECSTSYDQQCEERRQPIHFSSVTLQGESGGRVPWLGLLRFGEFPRLVGRYCSYLMSKQDGGTSRILVNPTKVHNHQSHPVHCVFVPSVAMICKAFLTSSTGIGLVLHLLCSPTGNQNFCQKTIQSIMTDGMKHSVMILCH